jgi:hypothetical protein
MGNVGDAIGCGVTIWGVGVGWFGVVSAGTLTAGAGVDDGADTGAIGVAIG